MKRKKWILMLTLCTSLVLGTVVTSVAATGPAPAQPMAQECGNCGQMRLLNQYQYGQWVYMGTTICEKRPGRLDEEYKRPVFVSVKCGNCGFTADLTTIWEKKVVCNH